MMVRNGLKTFSGNFMLVWKHLLYILVVFALTATLFALSLQPILERLKSSGWIDSLYAFFEIIYTKPSKIADSFGVLATDLYLVLFNNFKAVWGNYALSLFLLLVLPNFLYGIGQYALGVLTNARMNSLLNQSYAQKLMSTLGRSTRYSLIKMLLELPFYIIIIGVCFAYGLLVNLFNLAWLLLPIFIGVVLLVLAFKFVFFIGFLPEAVNSEGRLFHAFAEGIDNYTGSFMKKVLIAWGLYVMELAGVVFIGLFTIGSGLIITIPSIMVINVCCEFANYFSTRKENFYTGENTIVKPL